MKKFISKNHFSKRTHGSLFSKIEAEKSQFKLNRSYHHWVRIMDGDE